MINALINFIIWINKLNSNVDHNIYQLKIIHKVEPLKWEVIELSGMGH